MDNFNEKIKNINLNLKELIENFDNFFKSQLDITQSKYYMSFLNIYKNIIKFQLTYDFFINYLENKEELNILKYKNILPKNYIVYFDAKKTSYDENTVLFINNNLQKEIITKLNLIWHDFEIKKYKYYILEFEIKTNLFLGFIADGFLPINYDNRFPKAEYPDKILKIKLAENTELLKFNKIVYDQASKISVYAYAIKKDKGVTNMIYENMFNSKDLPYKKIKSLNKVKLKDLVDIDKKFKENKIFSNLNTFIHEIKYEIDLYLPINNHFYKLNYIDFNNFNEDYYNNNLGDLRDKIDKIIIDNNMVLKNNKLTNKPENLKNYFNVKLLTKININDFKDYDNCKNIVIHLSGGGFFVNLFDNYRHHLMKIVDLKNTVLYSIMYRLTPKYCFPDPLNDVLNTYFYILEKYKNHKKKIILYGDSAGGYLILSLVNYLILWNKPLPDKLIVFYPCIDVSKLYFNKGIFKSYDDPILHIHILNNILINFFRKKINLEKNFIANPGFFYDFIVKKYPSISLFYSDNDPFYYSCKKLFYIFHENQVNIKAFEFGSLYHGFIIFVQKFNPVFKEINKVLELLLNEIQV